MMMSKRMFKKSLIYGSQIQHKYSIEEEVKWIMEMESIQKSANEQQI